MIASHSCCRFVVCTSMMRISRSTTSQRCSIGLRSGDCGGHLSKVNSSSCSRNQSEMIWALWRCIILLEVHQKMVHCSHKRDGHGQQQYSGRLWRLNNVQLVLSVPRKYPTHHYTTTTSLNRWDKATLFNLLLSSFGDPVWIVFSVCCSYLTGAAPGVVFCCWSSSASGFDVLCVQRWYSADLGCNEWSFELLLSFYHL